MGCEAVRGGPGAELVPREPGAEVLWVAGAVVEGDDVCECVAWCWVLCIIRTFCRSGDLICVVSV